MGSFQFLAAEPGERQFPPSTLRNISSDSGDENESIQLASSSDLVTAVALQLVPETELTAVVRVQETAPNYFVQSLLDPLITTSKGIQPPTSESDHALATILSAFLSRPSKPLVPLGGERLQQLAQLQHLQQTFVDHLATRKATLEFESNIQKAIENGAEFAYFPKLSPELQIMIWKEAACSPRVFALDYRRNLAGSNQNGWIPASNVVSIRQVCHSARKEALKVESEFITFGGLPDAGGVHSFFTNRASATIWILHGQNIKDLSAGHAVRDLHEHISQHKTANTEPVVVQKLAISYSHLQEADEMDHDMFAEVISLTSTWKTKELLIVVGDERKVKTYKDIVFMQPATSPLESFKSSGGPDQAHFWYVKSYMSTKTKAMSITSATTWEDLEKEARENFQLVQAKRRWTRHCFAAIGGISVDAFDAPGSTYNQYKLGNISNWTVESICIMEARCGDELRKLAIG